MLLTQDDPVPSASTELDPNERHVVHLNCPLDLANNEIRVLELHPGFWDDPISCDFRVVSLNDAASHASYSALSYCWGNEAAICEVTINQKSFKIRPNLFNALRRLRAQLIQLVWVDALCIDQAWTQERNQQVSMMGQIYSRCREVLVWMSELETAWIYWSGTKEDSNTGRCYNFALDDADSTETFKYMPIDRSGWQKIPVAEVETFPPSEMVLHLAAFLHEVAWSRQFKAHFPTWGSEWQAARKEHFYKVLYDIRTNDWFTRLWTVQELILAPRAHIVLGPVLFPLETLLQARVMYTQYVAQKDWYQTLRKGPSRALLESGISAFAEMAVLRSRLRQKETKMSLLEVRLSLAHRLATMDVDQVFALLGLRSLSTVDSSITADYDREWGSVFAETCREHINQTSSLAILSVAGFRSWATVPSWAIVLSPVVDTYITPDYEAWGRLYSTFNAAYGLGVPEHQFAHDVLIVRGVKISHVIRNSNETNADRRSFRSGTFTPGKDLVSSAAYESYAAEPGTTWEEAWFRTLCADSIWPQASGFIGFPERLNIQQKEYLIKGPGRERCSHLDPWYISVEEGSRTHPASFRSSKTSSQSQEPEPEDGSAILETSIDFTLKNIFRDGSVFLTHDDQLGLCNNKIRAQDEIFLIAGCNMPLVMENTDGKYKLKGACYLHGYMNGEHNKRLLKDLITLEIV